MALVNGVESSCLDLLDRGLAYGDGVFRTLLAVDGILLHWSHHYRHLSHDCTALGISCPQENILLREARVLAAGQARCAVKIIVTRGSGARGYRPDPNANATRIVISAPAPEYPAEYATHGVQARVCRLRLSDQPRLAGIKHLNRLENVLARAEWDDPAIAEGLLLDARDHVIEGTMSNLFVVESGVLVTPPMTHSGVAGVQRERTMILARASGLAVKVENLPYERVLGAEEIFLTNSLIGLWKVRALEGARWHSWPVADLLRGLLDEADG